MSEPVTQAQFFEAMQQLLDKIDAKHSAIRQYVGERSDKIEVAMESHAAEDARQFTAVANRVLIIETQRTEEAKQALKHGTWAGIFAAAGLTGILKALEHWWK